MSDIKYSLRKLDFPTCAREALVEIERLLTGRSNPSTKQQDLATDLVGEFIFCEFDRRNSKKNAGLTSFQQLQLINTLIEYFSGSQSDNAKNKIFTLLFDRSTIHKRVKILCKLASLAIAASKPEILKLVGTCSQSTNNSITLAKNIIQDHFILQSTNDAMRNLPEIAPYFITDIMTAIVQMYLTEGANQTFLPPPISLLDTITHWVYSNPKLCLCQKETGNSSSSNQISPISGLAQWCILAPLFIKSKDSEIDLTDSEPQIKKIKKEKNEPRDVMELRTTQKYNSKEEMLYSKLHLGVIQTLHEAKMQKSPPLINSQQINDLINQLNKKFTDITKNKKNGSLSKHIQTSLDRLAQTIQISLACGTLSGNVEKVISQIDSLPYDCQLLKIVVKYYKK